MPTSTKHNARSSSNVLANIAQQRILDAMPVDHRRIPRHL